MVYTGTLGQISGDGDGRKIVRPAADGPEPPTLHPGPLAFHPCPPAEGCFFLDRFYGACYQARSCSGAREEPNREPRANRGRTRRC